MTDARPPFPPFDRFQYEWHDTAGQWFRSYGNELWEFDDRARLQAPLPCDAHP